MFPVADWFSAVAFPAQHFSVGKQCSHGKQGRGCADDVPWQPGNPSAAFHEPRDIFGSNQYFAGWWFGTFFIFHNIWDNPSH